MLRRSTDSTPARFRPLVVQFSSLGQPAFSSLILFPQGRMPGIQLWARKVNKLEEARERRAAGRRGERGRRQFERLTSEPAPLSRNWRRNFKAKTYFLLWLSGKSVRSASCHFLRGGENVCTRRAAAKSSALDAFLLAKISRQRPGLVHFAVRSQRKTPLPRKQCKLKRRSTKNG